MDNILAGTWNNDGETKTALENEIYCIGVLITNKAVTLRCLQIHLPIYRSQPWLDWTRRSCFEVNHEGLYRHLG